MPLIEKTFANKSDLFAYLKENKSDLIEMKRATKKTFVMTPELIPAIDVMNKSLSTSTKNDTEDMIQRTIVGNTYNWMDSHDDVHVGSTFSKSIGERVGKIWHLHDHEYKLSAKIGTPTKVYEKQIRWADLGVNKTGSTTSLMMDTNIKKSMNKSIFEEYKSGSIDQHSVGMYYVKIDLALNDPQYEEEFKVWNQYIDMLGNKNIAEDKGYFWAVKEAKLLEISAVLEGSNELTPTIEAKDNESLQDTQEKKPDQSTSNDQTKTKTKVPSYY